MADAVSRGVEGRGDDVVEEAGKVTGGSDLLVDPKPENEHSRG